MRLNRSTALPGISLSSDCPFILLFVSPMDYIYLESDLWIGHLIHLFIFFEAVILTIPSPMSLCFLSEATVETSARKCFSKIVSLFCSLLLSPRLAPYPPDSTPIGTLFDPFWLPLRCQCSIFGTQFFDPVTGCALLLRTDLVQPLLSRHHVTVPSTSMSVSCPHPAFYRHPPLIGIGAIPLGSWTFGAMPVAQLHMPTGPEYLPTFPDQDALLTQNTQDLYPSDRQYRFETPINPPGPFPHASSGAGTHQGCPILPSGEPVDWGSSQNWLLMEQPPLPRAKSNPRSGTESPPSHALNKHTEPNTTGEASRSDATSFSPVEPSTIARSRRRKRSSICFRTETKTHYRCTYGNCNKLFSRIPDLDRHHRGSHEGMRDFTCRVAGCQRAVRGFSRKDKRNDHERKMHKDLDGVFTGAPFI
ncbi:hypothetical protein BU26DRAFT_297146 [Trematosphaeria pertusa]|uniref:C2H2-type domain-containing protein n=1 Tax=Trematosphaeria pertusa TaxID=390896 RepID=A0A6A6IL35_9PLEO|nr:uncharacterized protein BU26DRAFT_297146 [Trematosphaeria pertusa]KAF2250203.1 hypothetical protein BU26DRAFT_297146 [Trematosphaeria pertusa]